MNSKKVIDKILEGMPFKEGARVRLKPNKEEGWPEQFGIVTDVEDNGMRIVQLDDKYIDGDDDDGVREVDVDQLEKADVKDPTNLQKIAQAKHLMRRVRGVDTDN